MPSPRTPVLRRFLPAALVILGVSFFTALAPAQSDVRGPEAERAAAAAGRERIRLHDGWRFALGHATDHARDFDFATGYFSYLAKTGYGDGPTKRDFDDRAWRIVQLPHDWAVELPFDGRGSASHGFKAIGRHFPEHSIGWYRRTFPVPASDRGRRITIEFDGVYRDAAVFVNGFFVGREPSGYVGAAYDITDYLEYGADNVVAVRADATLEEGWFYEGAGIYRHVWLNKTAPLHVARHGTYVTTELEARGTAGTPGSAGAAPPGARVKTRTTLTNAGGTDATFTLEQTILDPAGRTVAAETLRSATLAPGRTADFDLMLPVANPQLWSLENPALHRLVTQVRVGDQVVDRYETPFGIRTIRFDANEGFFLNDRHVVLKGMNVHQDHAGVGAALPDALHDYRLRQLKAFGVNAYRTGHRPPSPELLDACDRLGLLVIDENRLMGSNEHHLRQLEAMIRRDRNHPSIILWSIGNEEWAIEGNIRGARITATMQAFVQQFEPSRRVTVAISGGWGGSSTVADVVGYNYISQSNPDEQHRKFPQQPGVGTEETSTQGTRGIYFDDRAKAHLAPLAKGDSGGNCEIGWKYYSARTFLAGLFYWTGFDYRGEPTPFGWPAISSQYGLLDTCGFRKDSSYYLEAWWTDRPVLHLATHWNFGGREGQPVKVVVYANHEAVELFLNGASLGRQAMPVNSHLVWEVPYQPGTLEARGYRGNTVAQTARVETTGATARLLLETETVADPADPLLIARISAVDAQGRFVPTADDNVVVHVTGGRVIGVGNGNPSSHEPDQFIPTVATAAVEAWQGRIAPAGTVEPGARDALAPFAKLGHWQAPKPKDGEKYDLGATVTLAAADLQRDLRLFLPTFGARTSVWLNGKLLARDVDTTNVGPDIPLAATDVVPGANDVRMVVTPIYDHRNRIPELTRLGAVRIVTPAPTPQRQLFNGLAQVIIRPDADPKAVTLRVEKAQAR